MIMEARIQQHEVDNKIAPRNMIFLCKKGWDLIASSSLCVVASCWYEVVRERDSLGFIP